MRIEQIELRLLHLPLVRFFETSCDRVYERRFVVVTLRGEGEIGYGECVADETPYYSAETTETAWHVIRDFLAPRLLGVRFTHPSEVYPALKAVRGHQMAKAAVEMAAWDLWARQHAQPLWKALGGTHRAIASGVSVGIQDSLDELVAQIERELAEGYQRIKIKIKPGWDLQAVARVRSHFGSIKLMVDANAAYTLSDTEHLAALDQYDLMMIEQPLEYDDLRDHARLQRRLSTPVCLDESIHSLRAAEEAVELGACRIINIKPGRIGGFAESVRVHDLCQAHGIPVWHGGMLESGIGRTHNLHLSTLANFSLPGDVAASKRYYHPDLVEPPIEVCPDGTIVVPQGPGLGVTVVPDRIARVTERMVTLGEP